MTRNVGAIASCTIVLSVLPATATAAVFDTNLISRESAAGAGGTDRSRGAAISSDGDHVAFESDADNLSSEDDNSVTNVFIRDLRTGAVELVSRASGEHGVAGDGSSSDDVSGYFASNVGHGPSISADGRYVAFASRAANLIGGDDNGAADVFVRDTVAHTTTLASANPGGGPGHGFTLNGTTNQYTDPDPALSYSGHPSISGDGRYVAFESHADDLSTADDNDDPNVFLRDRVAGTTVALTPRRPTDDEYSSGNHAGGDNPAISADGSAIAFNSDHDFTTGSGDGAGHIMIVDRTGGAKVRTELATAGEREFGAALSGDGQRVAFLESDGTHIQVYRASRAGGGPELVSRAPGATGAAGDGAADPYGRPSLSGDGSRVAFATLAKNLDPDDPSSGMDVYVRDMVANTNTLASRATGQSGPKGTGDSSGPSITADATGVSFTSAADNLSAADMHGSDDVFTRQLGLQPPAGHTPPEITGPANADVGDTLSCSDGTWSHAPSSFTYSWSRNGTPIPGANAAAYVLTSDDAGQTVTCTVIAVNADGNGGATSAGFVVSLSAPPPLPPQPASTVDPPPKPSDDPTCESDVTVGPVSVRAACFRREGQHLISVGPVRVNGIDIQPGDKTFKVDLDPLNLRITISGTVSMRLGRWKLYDGPMTFIDFKREPDAINLPVDPAALLAGFPIKGKVSLNWVKNGVLAHLNLQMPGILGGVTGDASLSSTNDAGVRLESLNLSVPDMSIGKVGIKNTTLSYRHEIDLWKGQSRILLPTDAGAQIAASMTFANGKFTEGSIVVTNINLQIASSIYLQRMNFGIRLVPVLYLNGGIGVSVGPSFAEKGSTVRQEAISLDAQASYTNSDPGIFLFDGTASVYKVGQLGTAHVRYVTTGRLEFGANLGYPHSAPEKTTYGFRVDGGVKGFVDHTAFELDGSVVLTDPIGGRWGAEALVSNVGAAGCVLLGNVGGIGFGHAWDGSNDDVFAGACDLGPWRAPRPASGPAGHPFGTRAADPTTHTLHLPAGLPIASFEIAGATGPPQVTLTGPDGTVVSSPPDGSSAKTDRAWIVPDPLVNITYVAVARPAGGTWTVETNQGSPALRGIRQADGLPSPAVRATVTGRGRHRVLHWRLRQIPGQVVRFAESGSQTGRTITTARAASGSIAFAPADGHRGRRTILALVEQAGLPRASLVAGHYDAPGPALPARPRGLTLRRTGGSLLVRWHPVVLAREYSVTVVLRDGRRLLRTVGPHARRIVIPRITTGDGGTVSVSGIGTLRRAGPTAHATLKAAKKLRAVSA